jgi:hypothetical protein
MSPGPTAVNLTQRVRGLLTAPAAEWKLIAGERGSLQSLYTGYVMILAAIGPVMIVLSSLLFGLLGLAFGVRMAVVVYVTALVSVAVVALAADALSPSFGGSRDYPRTLALVAYSFTPAWIAQIALIVPILGGLVVLLGSIYAFYLFFVGAPVLGRSSVAKAPAYTLVVVLCTMVLLVVLRAMIFGVLYAPLVPGPVGLIR